jgi:hypothetical protein
MNTPSKTKSKVLAVAVAGGALMQTIDPALAAISVQLNGQPLNTAVAPVKMRNRTVVPMRDIFEALGATVNWNPATMGITAQKEDNTVNLAINNRRAFINGRQVFLDQPATLVRGRTMVPLRFVSEAMGAQVGWNEAMQMVSIDTPMGTVVNTGSPIVGILASGTPAMPTPATNPPVSGSQVAGVRYINIPSGVVVPVSLDQGLSSATTRVGDTFTANVISQRIGDSEFPAGTKIEGRVIEARPRQGDNPGVLDLEFRSALLPTGERVPLNGELVALDNESVISSNGRIVAQSRKGQSSSDRLKVVGIGAGAGFILGKVLDTNSTLTAVLGAAGGYLYSRTRDKSKAADAMLAQNTKLGVRLINGLNYVDNSNYGAERENFLRTNFTASVLGVPTEQTAYEQPAYVPTQPTYAPTQPAYQPTQPAYQPTQPVYQPAPTYPAQPAYPRQPVYQPAPTDGTQPVYPATQPAQPNYQPNYPAQPAYPGQPAYQPQPTNPAYTAALPAPQTPAYPPAYAPNPSYPANTIDLGQPGAPAYPAYPGAQPAYPGAYPPVGAQVAGARSIRVPSNVVVPVTMDATLSSANARVGQTFSATVVTERMGDSEFPAGTKIEGIVLEARPRQGNQPGVLDLDFRNAILPNGEVIPLSAALIALDNNSVISTNGRITARAGKSQSTGDRLKIVGIGAGLGFVLGKVLDKNTTVTSILGAAGGYLYSRSRDKGSAEAVVAAGTKLGVRLAAPVTYADYTNYSDSRTRFLRN